jgi:putative ubiquitin-RnfH superfamily antitoxin RatB of RatAB toxin-antitoxin module
MAGPEPMRVEIAWPDGADYRVAQVQLPAGATVRDAVAACPSVPRDVSFGVFGQPVQADTALSDGDRVELYLPLRVDPKTARRRRAATAEKNRARR